MPKTGEEKRRSDAVYEKYRQRETRLQIGNRVVGMGD